MKIAFFGTGEFSKNILESILGFNKIEIGLVVSQPDKAVGRKKIIEQTPVAKLATEKNIKLLQPEKLRNNTDFFDQLKGFDFIVVVAYGKIVPNEVLNAPKYGCINIHGSILPKYRGASPIQEAIKNGDKETGLTIMYMSEGMDEGDILDIKKIKIDNLDTTEDIFKKFEYTGSNLLIKTLKGIINGDIKGQKQDDSQATYCKKITKEDGEINFKNDTVQNIYNKYRAYKTWPGIFTYFNKKKLNLEIVETSIYGVFDNKDAINGHLYKLKPGSVIKINKKTIGIVCSDNKFLILNQVKLEGKKSMDIISFVNGNKDFLEYKF